MDKTRTILRDSVYPEFHAPIEAMLSDNRSFRSGLKLSHAEVKLNDVNRFYYHFLIGIEHRGLTTTFLIYKKLISHLSLSPHLKPGFH